MTSPTRALAGGLHEAAWRAAVDAWPSACCPPDAVGVWAVLRQRPRVPGTSGIWPVASLALCVACEENDASLLQLVLATLTCASFACPSSRDARWAFAVTYWAQLVRMILQRFEQRCSLPTSDVRSRRCLGAAAQAQVKTAQTGANSPNVMTLGATLDFLVAGGSIARMNDGELLIMEPEAARPVRLIPKRSFVTC